MKRGWIALSLLTVLTTFVISPAHAMDLEFGVFGSEMDSDDLGDGSGVGAKLGISPMDLLSLEARASWIQFDDFDIDMIPLEVAGRLNFSLFGNWIVPYVGAGAGYYMFEADDADLDDSVGFFPMVGLEVGVHQIAFFVEARWLFLETDVDSARAELDDIVEADVDGLGVNIGALVRF